MQSDEMRPQQPTDPTPEPPPESSPARPTLHRHPILAGILSLFPGAGNIYNGLYLRGITFFVLAAASIQMAIREGEQWGFVIAFVWIFNVLDAWRQANLINLGQTSDMGLSDHPPSTGYGSGSLAAGVTLILVGIIAFLKIQLDINIDWIFDL